MRLQAHSMNLLVRIFISFPSAIALTHIRLGEARTAELSKVRQEANGSVNHAQET